MGTRLELMNAFSSNLSVDPSSSAHPPPRENAQIESPTEINLTITSPSGKSANQSQPRGLRLQTSCRLIQHDRDLDDGYRKQCHRHARKWPMVQHQECGTRLHQPHDGSWIFQNQLRLLSLTFRFQIQWVRANLASPIGRETNLVQPMSPPKNDHLQSPNW